MPLKYWDFLNNRKEYTEFAQEISLQIFRKHATNLMYGIFVIFYGTEEYDL